MRILIVLTVAFLFGLTVPVFAGSLTYTDGKGNWQPSRCVMPQVPTSLSGNPEAAANDLNNQWTQHNQFVDAAQAYMNCVSDEAQTDANGSGQLVTQNAQALIQQMQATVSSITARLNSRKPVVVSDQ